MQVVKQDLKSGSCNFCTGKINKKGTYLTYDYTVVFEFMHDMRPGLSARICKKCLDELKYKTDKL